MDFLENSKKEGNSLFVKYWTKKIQESNDASAIKIKSNRDLYYDFLNFVAEIYNDDRYTTLDNIYDLYLDKKSEDRT